MEKVKQKRGASKICMRRTEQPDSILSEKLWATVEYTPVLSHLEWANSSIYSPSPFLIVEGTCSQEKKKRERERETQGEGATSSVHGQIPSSLHILAWAWPQGFHAQPRCPPSISSTINLLLWDRPSELGQEGHGAVADNSGNSHLVAAPTTPSPVWHWAMISTVIVCFINPSGHPMSVYLMNSILRMCVEGWMMALRKTGLCFNPGNCQCDLTWKKGLRCHCIKDPG